MRIGRRQLLAGGGLLAAGTVTGLARAATAQAADLKPIRMPPPIGRPERLARLARAQALMKANDIGAIIIEPGASLDYFTGVQWWRSERLTGTVIPASGDPIIVTPFFEKPSVEESLGVPAEIRTWNEDEEPLKLVADFLRERGFSDAPDRDGGDQPLLHPRPLTQQLPSARVVSANPVVRGCRMIKTDAETRADAGGVRHHARRFRLHLAAAEGRNDRRGYRRDDRAGDEGNGRLL